MLLLIQLPALFLHFFSQRVKKFNSHQSVSQRRIRPAFHSLDELYKPYTSKSIWRPYLWWVIWAIHNTLAIMKFMEFLAFLTLAELRILLNLLTRIASKIRSHCNYAPLFCYTEWTFYIFIEMKVGVFSEEEKFFEAITHCKLDK